MQARKELGLDGSEESLANMILARQQSRCQQVHLNTYLLIVNKKIK